MTELKNKIRKNEELMIGEFSRCIPFSEHLVKREDELLPDKYDQNFFEYSGQPSREEFAQAVDHQKKTDAGFIKLEGNDPLSDSFGLEESATLTMVLKSGDSAWRIDPDLIFHSPSLEELEEIEVNHFGAVYGEDFTRRNVRRLCEKLTYHGAYLDGKLVGACHSYCANGVTCLDGLIVDEAYRKQYVGTSLIAFVRRSYPDTVLCLHADEDDTPKLMYEKMGFATVDRRYEYLCTDISGL